MPDKKKIILCSDGTGNRGGVGYETNVWRLYHGLDHSGKDQVAFYDDGVGTQDSTYLKALTGSVGWGFTGNLVQLYRAFVRNYTPGDAVYLFGFSRGAYTVRALATFIVRCGAVSGARTMSDLDLDDRIDQLVLAYGQCTTDHFDPPIDVERVEEIEFVGVWDTVSALGLPVDIPLKESILQHVVPVATDVRKLIRVKRACHALALDEERRSFHPELWDESDATCADSAPPAIEQVWFAGMHSNVGGGYPKQELSNLAFDWMLRKVEGELKFSPGFQDGVRRAASPHGRIYDSRAGAGIYYRFSPRNIQEIRDREGVELKAVRVHRSVLDRLRQRANGYHPGAIHPTGSLPLHVVEYDGSITKSPAGIAGSAPVRAAERAKAEGPIAERKTWHLCMAILSLLLGVHLLWYYAPSSGATVTAVAAAALGFVGVYLRRQGRHRRFPRAFYLWVGVLLVLTSGLRWFSVSGGAVVSGAFGGLLLWLAFEYERSRQKIDQVGGRRGTPLARLILVTGALACFWIGSLAPPGAREQPDASILLVPDFISQWLVVGAAWPLVVAVGIGMWVVYARSNAALEKNRRFYEKACDELR